MRDTLNASGVVFVVGGEGFVEVDEFFLDSRYSTSSYYNTDSTMRLKWTMLGTSHGHSILWLAIANALVCSSMASTVHSILCMDVYHCY